MERNEILKRINEILCDLIDEDDIVLTEETTANDVDGWDSLTHISFISAIEDEYDIKFSMKDIVGLKNVGDLLNIIAEQV